MAFRVRKVIGTFEKWAPGVFISGDTKLSDTRQGQSATLGLWIKTFKTTFEFLQTILESN